LFDPTHGDAFLRYPNSASSRRNMAPRFGRYLCKPNEAIGGERKITCNEPFESTSYDIVVDENDIESDEDQLRVELE
jgi:hypothetical protein